MAANEALEVAERLFRAIEKGDAAAIRSIYAPDVVIWHNNDQKEQTADENLRVLGWVIENLAERKYDEIRRQPTPTGFVQQHVLRGKFRGREFALPACIVCVVKNGKITRLDEYLDSGQTAIFAA